jgi:Protein of unknown function (DUF2938)
MTTNDMMFIGLTGIGATVVTDLWCLLRERVLAVPFPNYAFVGRWVGHMARSQLTHDSIAAAAPVRAEKAIGLASHYLIGVGFAFLLPAIWGGGWIRRPTLGPALLVGLFTVIAPFFVMQPAMGAGIAASRTARPAAARIHSLVMHAVFGIGLYIIALIVSSLSIGE